MNMLFVVLLFVLLYGFAVGVVKEYIFLNRKMNWTDAHQHCRRHYGDLASVSTWEENQIIRNAAGENLPDSWIGLYRSQPNVNSWLWSDGSTSSFNDWGEEQPNNVNNSQNCVQLFKDGWNDYFCWTHLDFFCEKILVLVTQSKTWEEAHEYCRDHHRGLASLTSETDLNMARREMINTQTVSVWTGLRFLAGHWIWLNGESTGSLNSLPSCPAQPYRCGAHNSETNTWENRDCEEKLNFLCY